MRENVLLFVRGVLIMAALLLIVFGLELALELRGGRASLTHLTFSGVSDARQFNNLLGRGLGQLASIIFTMVAIAVPLTANLYSLKVLEFFIRDPVNAAVLILVVSANVANLWSGYILNGNVPPFVHLHVLLGLTVFCFALVFPYLYYVFRFLHPRTLLARLEGQAARCLDSSSRRTNRVRDRRRQVAESAEHIANIAVRSADRGDRSTAIESVLTLERVLRRYWAAKEALPTTWFVADKSFFPGFSSRAVDELTATHTWTEMKILAELRQVVTAALGRLPELVSTAAEVLRKVGLETPARKDAVLREMVIEYFNTFLRLALNRKDARSLFILMDQYRMYAEALNQEHPDVSREIAYYFRYYGQVASDAQLPFVVEAVAHDLGTLVKASWESGAPNRAELLEEFLAYDAAEVAPLPGVKKAHALLASYFLLRGWEEPASRVRESFRGISAVSIRKLEEELLRITREKYWEVNERRMNIHFVSGAQRDKLRLFFDGILGPRPEADVGQPSIAPSSSERA